MMDEAQPLLRITALEKAFESVKVLTGINLSLRRGEMIGLIGENGAGKSTLARCISGKIHQNSGTISFSPKQASVYVIPQEFNLIPSLNVFENLFLGREWTRWGILDKKGMIARSKELFQTLERQIDPCRMVSDLSVAEKQIVEIAKAFLFQSEILIMDEPTTVLNKRETRVLFKIMKQYCEGGGGILYISHKLDEVREICDRIVVLRDGVLVSDSPAKQFTSMELAQKMVGRNFSRMFPPRQTAPSPDVPWALEVRSLSCRDCVHDVSFSVRRGEILGIAGLAGAGRTELAETICGLRRRTSGTVLVSGKEVRFRRYAQALKAGISYLSEDRQGTGVLTASSLASNVTLASLGQYTFGGFVRDSEIRNSAAHYVRQFQIRASSLDTPLRSLSGGNQQKVALAKGLDTHPEIFIFDEPTRGVDVAARGEIYQFIHHLADQGVSCILISSDLEEVIGNCRRILVMRNGTIAGELTDGQISEEEIMYLAIGVKE